MKYVITALLLLQLTTLFIIAFISFPAQAQTVTYYCKYLLYSDMEGLHQAEEDFLLTFVIDSQLNTAFMTGNNGSSTVVVVNGSDGLTFIQETQTGNVMATTITSELKSVHSRNSVIFGELIPSQYYGSCEKR